MEIRPNREHHASTLRQPSQRLPLAAEIVVADRFVFLGRVPTDIGRIFTAYAVGPGEVVVDLQEVVVSGDDFLGFEAAEEIHHAFLEFLAELRDVSARVDFAEGHAEFVFEAPEAGEEDRAGEEVVLAVGALDHDGEVVLG